MSRRTSIVALVSALAVAAALSGAGLMNHMGASTKVTFSKPGIYRFHTRAGADYMPGIRTSGADNDLTFTVSVRH